MSNLAKLLVLAVAFLLTSCATPRPPLIVQWVGIYTVKSETRIDDATYLNGKRTENVGATPTALTKYVPGTLGTRFGVGFALYGHGHSFDEAVVLRTVWHFPKGGITNPLDGRFAESYEWKQTCRASRNCSVGFSFKEPWEIVFGKWTLEIWDGQTKLLSQDFEVVPTSSPLIGTDSKVPLTELPIAGNVSLTEYPPISRRNGEEGLVLTQVFVNEKGQPETVKLQKSSGFPNLDLAAMTAVKRMSYQPGKLNGEPAAMWMDVPINFVLQTSNDAASRN